STAPVIAHERHDAAASSAVLCPSVAAGTRRRRTDEGRLRAKRRARGMSKVQPPKSSADRRAVTIFDVARRAGVSTATVSRALATPEQVAEQTRNKVFAAIAETGYTPNATARNLRSKSTKMVLALLPGLGNSFWNVIINAVEEVLTEAGYGVIFGDTRNDPWRENHYDQLVRGGQVDGVLLFTGRLPREGFALLDRAIPITLVCNEVAGL